MNTSPTRRAGSRRGHRALAVTTTALLVLGASCTGDSTADDAASPIETTSPVESQSSVETSSTGTTSAATSTSAAPADSALTDDEIAGLLWMREEEQLAHDVYVALSDFWDLRIFENIAASETAHIDAVSGLLDQFDIDDLAAGNEPGEFTDPTLQDLYDRLVADGSASLDAALNVGALIEELDISDLQIRSAATDVSEIIAAYATLERGSRNHLRAFTSQLESRGITYDPIQLDSATFDAIVSSETERGRDG